MVDCEALASKAVDTLHAGRWKHSFHRVESIFELSLNRLYLLLE